MKIPKVSVIIRTYNEGKFIGKCLDAVFKQKADFHFEVIIVDSESMDRTVEIAKKFPVKIIEIKKKDFTYGISLNIGCDAATGSYLVFLSAHAIPANDSWLKTLIDSFDNEKIAGVYGKQIPAKDCNPSTKRQMEAHWKDKKRIQSKNSFFANPNSAILKEVWQRIKFDERLTGSEDHDWAKRAQTKGYLIVYEPKAVVFHSHNESFKQLYRRYYRESNSNFDIYNMFYILKYIADSIYHFVMDILYIIRKRHNLSWVCVSFVNSILFFVATVLAFLNSFISEVRNFFWKCKVKPKHILRKFISSVRLHKIDSKRIPSDQNEIRLFMVVRNESLRLPYIFKYYLDKGVDRIFVIDNNSTDDTVSFLLSQKNTHVFQTKETFKKYWIWNQILLERYGKGHWCVVVDADEIVSYPNEEELSIKDLCGFLEKEGSTALRCLFLDMYSNQPIHQNNYRKGENPLDVCPYFDPGYRQVRGKYLNDSSFKEFDFDYFKGGMRERVFGLDTLITKVPLFIYIKGTYLYQGQHAIGTPSISDLQGVVHHFKYLYDFNKRVIEEAKREEHWNNAVEYKEYAKKIKENSDLNLYYNGSRKYRNTKQLVKLGLMNTSDEFEEFVKEEQK